MYNFKPISDFIKNYIDSNKISGASIAIYKDNKELYKNCFGLANIENNYPITLNTKFRLASMTKPITAVAIMICEEKGLLNTNDYIDEYIPSLKNFIIRNTKYEVLSDTKYRLKISSLLRHCSGLGSGDLEPIDMAKFLPNKDRGSLEKVVGHLNKYSLSFEPEKYSSYSALTCYEILARIVEIVSKMPYLEFLNKNIFKPLGMTHTSYTYDENDTTNKAINYIYNNGKLIYFDEQNKGFDTFLQGYTGGSAGLISTLDDYCKFALMLANNGKYNQNQIIKSTTLKKMLEFIPLKHPKWNIVSTFGYSFYIRNSKDQPLPLGTFGWSGAYGSHFFIIPSENIVVVYMHNSKTFGGSDGPHIREIETAIKEIFNL